MALPPFQALLDSHGPDVHRFLIATIGRGDAEDCYQETWLAALRGYPDLKDASNLRGWLLTIAHRKAIDHARGRTRRAVPVAELPDTPQIAIQPTDLDGRPEIFAYVRALPPKQRTAVALRFVADASYADIAAAMQISQDAARRNVHEGLNRLRRDYRT